MASSWRHNFFYIAHALVQRIIFKTCGRSRPHLLYFSKYKRSKSGHFRWYNYHYLCMYVSGTKPQGLFKTDPLSVQPVKKMFKNLFSQKNDLLHVSDDSKSIWANTFFLNFLVKYSTSAHYGGHTIHSFPKSFDISYYWVEMNILTTYGDQWMIGVTGIKLQKWDIS